MKKQKKKIEHNHTKSEVWYAVLNNKGYITYSSPDKSDAMEVAGVYDEVIQITKPEIKSI